ncbi:HAMP domain-containing sensor histidine kinase [Clostridium sp. CF012]|uniref:sensor histidine kinase n=1 Tax=Clostridium sp. CF012 TaxID=2843319 RepID=UPI001C0C10A1|nr:HAMP domain-containing sensor histidine kinase [Clostridium sp. CF012]MBU3143354.1 HAMP domain-containing protein [Clostridium sp. CF012]
MKISLTKKLSLGFLLAIITSILITSLISNYRIDKEFNRYLVDEHTSKIESIVKIVEDLYTGTNGYSDLNKDEIQRYAVSQELFIQIKDIKGNLIFSSGSTHLQNRSKGGSMMDSMMHQSSNNNLGEYLEAKHPLLKNGNTVGYLVAGYFSTSYLTNAALTFTKTLNQSFMLSAFIALLIGLFISIILSKQISTPLIKITSTANKMRDGHLDVRCSIKTKTKEIHELSNSINYLAETLSQQEMLRKRFTSDMAHEIRTPLTTLKTHVEAILDGVWEPTKERLEVFSEEIDRLTKLVDNLRNLAKLEQADLNLNKTKFNLSNELSGIINNFQLLYSKSGFTLTSTLSDNIAVSMDKDKLKQIMYNLLTNAYNYLNKGGQVQILLEDTVNHIVIKVVDTGLGIDEKDLPYLFERFYRSDVSRNKDSGGSGIGLTITKALVEAHNGKIFVESKVGEGSTFIIELPKSLLCSID